MPSIDDIVNDILRREGGFVNDPDDPGGATNLGVTIHTMHRLGLDMDEDGDIDETDVRLLDKETAISIYKEHYYLRPGISHLPDALQASVFDMYVNAGANAVKILQRLLLQFGFVVRVDGVIGPETIRATHAAYSAAPDHFVDAYGIARRNYYYNLADRRPSSRKFARRRDGGKGGWILRAEEFISEKYHLSPIEHSERIASWG